MNKTIQDMILRSRAYRVASSYAPRAVAKWRRRFVFDDLAQYERLLGLNHPSFVWMNYGLDGEDWSWVREEDWRWRYQLNLARHTLRGMELASRRVLDTGSGRGGNCSFIRRYHRPSRVVGLDQNRGQVEWCRQRFRDEEIEFVEGDSHELPFDEDSFDVVTNIESACHYADLPRFYREVFRVLSPNGHFCHSCIYHDPSQKQKLMEQAGFMVLDTHDITEGVIAALIANNGTVREWTEEIAADDHEREVGKYLSDGLVRITKIMQSVADKHRYHSWILRKPS